MPADGGEVVNQPIAEYGRIKTILTGIGSIFLILYVLSILATRLLPHPPGTTISSILLNIAVVIFLCAVPFLEVILWTLRKALPRSGSWGLLLLLVGIAILIPVGAILIFFSTLLPALSYPFPLLVAASVVMGIGFVLVTLGLLIVFMQLAWEILRLFRDRRRQARIGRE